MEDKKNDISKSPKMGRPTKYDENMSKLLIDAMKIGKSVTAFCAEQDISKPTFYLWVKTYEEFSNAFDRAAEKCEYHWEKWLVENLSNKELNGPLVKMYFTNRFGWSDKKEVNQNTTHSLCDDTKRKVREVIGE